MLPFIKTRLYLKSKMLCLWKRENMTMRMPSQSNSKLKVHVIDIRHAIKSCLYSSGNDGKKSFVKKVPISTNYVSTFLE